MSKKVLILSGSPRKGGNSDILCDEFLRGAQDAGHKAEKIRVAEKKVAPCSGCYYCSTHGGACVHKDDMADILQKMIDADVIVLASPVYFYSIQCPVKAVIDRTVARWLEVKDKEFYYITTMADEEKASADTTLTCFRGYADCVEGAVEKGVLVACGVYEPGAGCGAKHLCNGTGLRDGKKCINGGKSDDFTGNLQTGKWNENPQTGAWHMVH